MGTNGGEASAAALLEATLDCGNPSTTGAANASISCISSSNYLLVANDQSGGIYVHGNSPNAPADVSTEKNVRIFPHHKNRVTDMMVLFGDTIASVDEGGKLLIWAADDNFTVLDDLENWGNRRLLYIESIDSNTIMIGASSSSEGYDAHHLYLFSHNAGRKLEWVRDMKVTPGWVVLGVVHGNLFAKTTDVAYRFNIESCKENIIAAYKFDPFGAVSEHYIILSFQNKSLFVYRNNSLSVPLRKIEAESFIEVTGDKIVDVIIVINDLLMVTTQKFGLYFIDVQGKLSASLE